MPRPVQSDLYAQRPVRSDFGRQQRMGGGLNWARLMMLVGGLGVALAGGYGLSQLGGSTDSSEGIPHIKAEGPIKEKPENPGGIDIPHQDVQVFHELDTKTAAGQQGSKIEHLLPAPDTPQPVAAEQMKPSSATAEREVLSSLAPVKVENVPVVRPEAQPSNEALPDAADSKPLPIFDEKPVEEAAPPAAQPKAAVAAKPVEAPKVKEAVKQAAPAVAKTAKQATPAKDEPAARLPAALFTSDNPEKIKQLQTQAPAEKAETGKKVRIQLASLPDQDSAQATAQKLQSQHAAALAGATLTVARAEVAGKGTYYRVVSAPMAEMQAKSICAELSKKKTACLVAR